MEEKPMSFQESANHYHAVVVKEWWWDGMRVYAYPMTTLLPGAKNTQKGLQWSVNPKRICITSRIAPIEVTSHNPNTAVYPTVKPTKKQKPLYDGLLVAEKE